MSHFDGDEIPEKCGLTLDGEADSRAEDGSHQESGLNTNYDSSDGAIPTHRCDGCDYETMSSSALGRHATSCQGGKGSPPGSGKGSDSGGNMNGSSSKMFECDICQMRFSNGANMRRHKMRHTGVKPYECRVCGKRFFRKDHLAEHTTTHAKALPWACPICHRGFQRQIAMRAHFQNEHVMNGGDGSNGEVKCCPLCSYKGTSMKSLRVHFYNRHGIDLDRPTLSPGLGAVAAVLGNGLESDRGGDNVTPPMHFLTPHIEISTQNSPQMNGLKSDDNEAIDLHDHEDSSPRGSPDSMDSNAPTSSLSERIKAEPGSDGGDTYDCCTTNGNSRCSPVNLTVTSRQKEESALVRLLVNGTSSPGPRQSSPPPHGVPLSPTNLAVRSSAPNHHSYLYTSGGDTCGHCKIRFPDRTLYFLHKGCHAEGNPWKCNICGEQTSNVYDFNSHLLSSKHQ